MKRAAGYIRVSTKTQATHGESLSTQRKAIKNYVKSQNWKFTEIYADEGISGSSVDNREAFKRLMEDAKESKFDIISYTQYSFAL